MLTMQTVVFLISGSNEIRNRRGGGISQNFVAFSEYTNFTINVRRDQIHEANL